MHIMFNVFYFIVFLILAVAVMFVGGVSGVAGAFYLMIEPGSVQDNLFLGLAVLLTFLLVIMLLRKHNKKIIRRNKRLAQEALDKEALDLNLEP